VVQVKDASIVIPIYNEGERLEKSIQKLVEHVDMLKKDYEIILSDDGSTDNSLETIKKLSKSNSRINYLHNKENLGRGNALKKACKAIKGSKVIFMDADTPLVADLTVMNEMLGCLDSHDVVIASRFLPESKTKRKIHRGIMSKTYRFLVRLFFPALMVSDTDVGFKGFKKSVFVKINKHIKSNGWSWDLEFMLESRKRKYTIKEIPLMWCEEGKSSVNILRDSFAQLFSIFTLKMKYGKYFNR